MLKKNFINVGSEEKSQACIRLGVCSTVLLYLAGIWLVTDIHHFHNAYVISAYAVFSLAWLFWIKQQPHQNTWRCWIAIVSDLLITSYFMYSLADWGAAFYPLYLWIVLGNGIRFGIHYLAGAAIIAIMQFAAVLYYSGYWSNNLPVGLSLFLGLIILPAFYFSVVRRLHKLNDRLLESLAQTQRAVGAKDDFLSHMSHELRTPMNGILGIAKLLRDTPLNDKQQEYLNLMHGSSGTLLNIINDILDYSAIGANKINLAHKPFDMLSTIDEVQALMRTLAVEKGLALHVDIAPNTYRYFLGDAARLSQILLNLFGNAVKFTQRGGIYFRYWGEPRDANTQTLFLVVKDTGIGISEENLGKIFTQFERVDDDKSMLPKGTGLGLTISQGLAQAMGGGISVESQYGKGSTFTLRLTLEIAHKTELDTRKQHKGHNDRCRLLALVAEDNHVNQIVTQGLLRSIGIDSVIAENGKEALKQFESGDYDLIFMDVQMPEMDGLEATRKIRSLDINIPIIGLTANASRKDHNACIDAGMNVHVKKPTIIDELINTLKKLQDEQLLPQCTFKPSQHHESSDAVYHP